MLKNKVEQKLKFHKEQLQTLTLSLSKFQEEIQKAIAANIRNEKTALTASAVLVLQQNIRKHEGAIEAYNDVLKDLN